LLFFIFDILLFPLRSTEKSKSGQKKKEKEKRCGVVVYLSSSPCLVSLPVLYGAVQSV